MSNAALDVLHDIDPSVHAEGVSLRSLGARLAVMPAAERERLLAGARAAKPLKRVPNAKAADARAELRQAMAHVERNEAFLGYLIFQHLMVEWPRRINLEAFAERSALDLDAASARTVLGRTGNYSKAGLKLASEHMGHVARVLRSSGPVRYSAPGGDGSAARPTLVGNLGLAKPSRRFRNPCRPLASHVTTYPQKDALWKGVPIRYLDVPATPGATLPPLVLLHGHSSCAEEYETLIGHLRPLLSNVRILVPDMPGSGYSWAAGHGRLTTEIYRGFIKDWLLGLGVKRYVPAGGSMGGNLTLQLLASSRIEEIPAGVAWAPVSWRKSSPDLDWVAAGAALARGLRLFWPVYHEDKKHWFPNWSVKRANAELWYSDTYRREVNSCAYEDAFFDLAIDQCTTLHLEKADRIVAPLKLMAGKQDDDVMRVHATTKELAGLLRTRIKCEFFDDFVVGDHSVATEEPELVAQQLASWYRTHVG